MTTMTTPTMPQTRATPGPAPTAVTDPLQAGLMSISASLDRRGYLTTEWWTTVAGTAITMLLAYVRPGDSAAPQTAAIIAPALISMVYMVSRTAHKSALADVLQAAMPDAAAGVAPSAG